MKVNGFSHIRKWLWIYFLLLITVTLGVYLLVFQQIDSLGELVLKSEISSHATLLTNQVKALKLRFFLVITSSLAVLALIGLLWIRFVGRQLGRPIRQIDRAIVNLVSGKLNETVDIQTADEFGKIASGLNELAANLQELLLYIWKQSGQCLSILKEISAKRNDSHLQTTHLFSHEEMANIKQIEETLSNLREMAKSYVFYDVNIENEKALAIGKLGEVPRQPLND
jgi:methyl-accepting chemotaxis protein